MTDQGAGQPPPAGTEAKLDELLAAVARTPAAAAHKQPGDCFGGGRYRVERYLGSGGQKVVFMVRDIELERDCALSVIQPELLEPTQQDRFRLEARALARFGAHPNIVTIYDIGEEDGLPFVLCEYLDGGDLRATIAAGAVPVDRALVIAIDICRALAFAHDRGVVHRDVKPGNIWLLRDGTAKLGDFGLAHTIGQSRLTRPGGVLGTAAYMPPEQAMGKQVDARSDLYALGCVLYELLTGAPPFVDDKELAVIAQHLHAEPPRLEDRADAVGADLDQLLQRLLAKNPDDRPASATEVLAELDRLLAAARGPVRAPPIPANEGDRLAELHALGILDTPPEIAYDELTELAAQLCDCPVSYICFIDETRQWTKARVGMAPELAVAPREIGVCQTTICGTDVLVSPDMTKDARFRDLPPVAGGPRFRFYCGAPLVTSRGHALGTICVMDYRPRQLDHQQIEAIRRLARQVVTNVELRRATAELERTSGEIEQARRETEAARARIDALLCSILPAQLAAAPGDPRQVEPRYHDSVTVGVATLRGLSPTAAAVEPVELVRAVDELLAGLDDAVRSAGIEKLKLLGGTYLFAGGVPEPSRRHPVDACLAALSMRRAARRLDRDRDELGLPPWELRIALHSGPAVTGVVGSWKPSYDLWGSSAEIAGRIESIGEPGQIAVSESTYHKVKDLFVCEPAGSVDIEDRGAIAIFSLERIAASLAEDPDGELPNDRFRELVRQRFGD